MSFLGSTNSTTPEDDVNCHDALFAQQAKAQPGTYNPTTDFTCGVLTSGQYQNGLCQQLKVNDCCIGNQAVMLSQSFMNPFPPCLLKYCKSIAPTTSLCGKHFNFDTGNIQGFVYLGFPPPKLPYMYKNISALMFQAILTKPLKLNPLQASIYDFTYFSNGVPISTNTASSYSTATTGNFSFLITMVGSNQTDITEVANFINSPTYEMALRKAFNVTTAITTVTAGVMTTRFYPANPIIINSSGTLRHGSLFWTMLFGVMVAVSIFSFV